MDAILLCSWPGSPGFCSELTEPPSLQILRIEREGMINAVKRYDVIVADILQRDLCKDRVQNLEFSG